MGGRPAELGDTMTLHRGKVTALTGVGGPGVYVHVGDLNDRHSWGPCILTETVRRLGQATGAQTFGTAHTHPLAGPLAVGDSVLVSPLGVGSAELVIIDRL